jgi:hypothetical protein
MRYLTYMSNYYTSVRFLESGTIQSSQIIHLEQHLVQLMIIFIIKISLVTLCQERVEELMGDSIIFFYSGFLPTRGMTLCCCGM